MKTKCPKAKTKNTNTKTLSEIKQSMQTKVIPVRDRCFHEHCHEHAWAIADPSRWGPIHPNQELLPFLDPVKSSTEYSENAEKNQHRERENGEVEEWRTENLKY